MVEIRFLRYPSAFSCPVELYRIYETNDRAFAIAHFDIQLPNAKIVSIRVSPQKVKI
jgi:hypothetical protein